MLTYADVCIGIEIPFLPEFIKRWVADKIISEIASRFEQVCVCVCVYIYVYIYVCMYVCMYVCIYIYQYTHTGDTQHSQGANSHEPENGGNSSTTKLLLSRHELLASARNAKPRNVCTVPDNNPISKDPVGDERSRCSLAIVVRKYLLTGSKVQILTPEELQQRARLSKTHTECHTYTSICAGS